MKRIIGVIIILNITPCLFVVFNILEGNPNNWGHLIAYLIGWGADLFIIVLFGILRFTFWCFDI